MDALPTPSACLVGGGLFILGYGLGFNIVSRYCYRQSREVDERTFYVGDVVPAVYRVLGFSIGVLLALTAVSVHVHGWR